MTSGVTCLSAITTSEGKHTKYMNTFLLPISDCMTCSIKALKCIIIFNSATSKSLHESSLNFSHQNTLILLMLLLATVKSHSETRKLECVVLGHFHMPIRLICLLFFFWGGGVGGIRKNWPHNTFQILKFHIN